MGQFSCVVDTVVTTSVLQPNLFEFMRYYGGRSTRSLQKVVWHCVKHFGQFSQTPSDANGVSKGVSKMVRVKKSTPQTHHKKI